MGGKARRGGARFDVCSGCLLAFALEARKGEAAHRRQRSAHGLHEGGVYLPSCRFIEQPTAALLGLDDTVNVSHQRPDADLDRMGRDVGLYVRGCRLRLGP